MKRRWLVVGLVVGLSPLAVFRVASQGPTSVSPHAEGYFAAARQLHAAVIKANLQEIKTRAWWLTEHLGPVPAPLERYREATTREATTLMEATDPAIAFAPAAALFASCGDCHQAAAVAPPIAWPSLPDSPFIVGHMARHQGAADLMLQGLVVPSGTAWAAGAEQLIEAPLIPGEFPVSTRIGRLMSEIEKHVHARAATAARASDRQTRVREFGALLDLCANCHARHTTLWESPR
jgi:cytochrome c553